MAINGKDCMCAAQHEGECACGCDWTTPKEARLESLNAELLAACKAGVEILEELGYVYNRTRQMMRETIDRAEATNE